MHSGPSSVIEHSDIGVREAFSQWVHAVRTGDVQGVCGFYHVQARLWETFAADLRNSPSGIHAYFDNFLNPFAPEVTCEEMDVRFFENMALNSGRYSFTFSNRSPILARFSFDYEFQADGTWLIVDHHSSQVPG